MVQNTLKPLRRPCVSSVSNSSFDISLLKNVYYYFQYCYSTHHHHHSRCRMFILATSNTTIILLYLFVLITICFNYYHRLQTGWTTLQQNVCQMIEFASNPWWFKTLLLNKPTTVNQMPPGIWGEISGIKPISQSTDTRGQHNRNRIKKVHPLFQSVEPLSDRSWF